MIDPFIRQDFVKRVTNDLMRSTLPFWMQHSVDTRRGGFYGLVTNDRRVVRDAPRAVVITARILWTFSAVYRRFRQPEFSQMATHAYRYLTEHFRDPVNGGYFWMLSHDGRALNDRKQIYAQAFALYGLSEYHRALRFPEALEAAKAVYRLIEDKSRDAQHGGYFEAYAGDWSPLEDMRLSEKDRNSPKSMNTLLHLLEAYTNLLRAWPDAGLRGRVVELVEIFLQRIIDPQTRHFRLFFNADWQPVDDLISFGHDIEGSWLLVEAADASGDKSLQARTRQAALEMANAVYAEGREPDGSLLYEARPGGITDARKHWWAQAEAVVGFLNAYQISQERRFFDAARDAWDYIEDKVVDRQHGEWFAVLERDGTPVDETSHPEQVKVGPWKCPYHNARACLEVIQRLGM